MSAVLQARIKNPDVDAVRPVPVPDDPLQLLRVAIHRLNSSNGELQDQAQMANLLGEVQEALERANVIGRAFAQCEESVTETKFDEALQSIDDALIAYPGDAALLTRRREVEERQAAFASATTVRGVLDEAEWLIQQDRPDLAARLLKEKATALPDQPALVSRLAEIDASLPQWEQDREVHAALERVAALEERQQWQVALSIVDDTLQSYSASAELKDAACRVKERLEQNERQNRLERRLRLIAQKVASRAWKQAVVLLETTEKEFPGAVELKPLQREVAAGLRREECDTIVSEVRQCLTDGELEQAEQTLHKGMQSLGQEPALAEVRAQLQSEKQYRNEFRKAQAFFGRRQLAEAERILTELAAQNRTEAQSLLEAVRQARAVSEEESFCERGREKALKLMQQQQFAQAADLLDNLRGLFPDNPILERDLAAARAAIRPEPQVVPAETYSKEEAPAPPVFAVAPPISRRPAAGRRAVIVGATALVAVSAAGVTWKLSQNTAPPTIATTRAEAIQPPAVAPPNAARSDAPASAPAAITESVTKSPEPSTKPKNQTASAPAPAEPPATHALRQFVPPAAIQKAGQTRTVAAPQDIEPIVSAQSIASGPASSANLIGMNASLPPAQLRATAPAPQPAAAQPPAAPVSTYREAQLINRTLPAYPSSARLHGITGTVKLQATIDERGNVKSVKVLSGDSTLASSASQAVAFWKYKPATANGKPIASTANVDVTFNNPVSGDSKK